MDIIDRFLAFSLLGAEWVMWLLVGISVVSVAIMIERLRFFHARRVVDVDQMIRDFRGFASRGDVEAALEKYGHVAAIEVAVGLAGVREAPRGPEAAAEAMIGVKARGRHELERNLAFLGTVGNNAPFIGLFGTCIGVIKAFHDLSKNSQDSNAVMAGISEALVATAVGLLVAIPAVVMFNYFQRRVRTAVTNADSLAHEVLAQLRGEGAGAAEKEAA